MKNISKLARTLTPSITLALIGMAVLLLATHQEAFANNFTVAAVDVKPQNGLFAFPVSEFQDGKARHFNFKISPNQSIRFFVIKSSDGVIRAAFDACEVCYRAKKGYAQQGDNMVCLNCGMKFKSVKVNEVTGGCNPSALKRTVKDGNVIISQQDLLVGAKYFQ